LVRQEREVITIENKKMEVERESKKKENREKEEQEEEENLRLELRSGGLKNPTNLRYESNDYNLRSEV
jgi:hypothetical protein